MKSRSFWASLHDAASGVVYAFASQRNMKIHLIAAILVVAVGLFLGLNRVEWSVIILTITVVWAAEIVNTSLEEVVDLLSPQYSLAAGRAKNLSAGAVLVTALGAAAVGVMIFGPRLIHWLEGFSR
ncbi:MAG: diacylglycerol kinase family protein [Syntrophomonadaceae bacterium]|nr:diacylglycerol kinase family protein [Syntrophomonadaceae bacterium]